MVYSSGFKVSVILSKHSYPHCWPAFPPAKTLLCASFQDTIACWLVDFRRHHANTLERVSGKLYLLQGLFLWHHGSNYLEDALLIHLLLSYVYTCYQGSLCICYPSSVCTWAPRPTIHIHVSGMHRLYELLTSYKDLHRLPTFQTSWARSGANYHHMHFHLYWPSFAASPSQQRMSYTVFENPAWPTLTYWDPP